MSREEVQNDIQYPQKEVPRDLVEVVRCKNCRHYTTANNGCNGMCDIQLTMAQDKLYHQRCDAVRAWNRRKSSRHEIELVRCKDCMHNGSFDTDCPIDWNGKEYCSFAERKEDE